MEKTIYILRHGETDYNKNNIIQGSGVNSDINRKGAWQADSFFHRYRNVPFDLIISSTLKRTEQSISQFISLGIQHEKFEEINEINWGIHEGKSFSQEMKNNYRHLLNQWGRGEFNASIKGGESETQLSDRLSRFIEILRNRKEKNILVCSHGRAIRCLICLMKKRPLSEMELFPHHNTGLYLAKETKDGYNFTLENNILHLDPETIKFSY